MDVSIEVGGDAGQGVESAGTGLSLALARGGLHVFGMADYRSRIRGGRNFYQVRASDRPVRCHSDPVHLVAAFTQDAAHAHVENIAPGGGVVYDEQLPVDETALIRKGIRPMPMPLNRVAEEAGSKATLNVAAVGAALGVVGYPLHHFERVIFEKFGRRGEHVVDINLKAARASHDHASSKYGPDFPFRLHEITGAASRMLINGNQALALGAVAGGCRFISAYPMTPATTILEWTAARAGELGIVTVHAEDEIAAVCMAAGASFAGARAMTATSGGGFCLMTEAIGMAAMTEVPIVVVDVQRGGPSTGLPTRTEQADLLLAIHPSHGDFPHIVLAPGTVEECFEAGWRSFNLAEEYQCPVVVLSDAYLGGSLRTVGPAAFDWDSVVRDRGSFLPPEILDSREDYQRFAWEDSGVSPRAAIGHPRTVHAPSTDEHDEAGHITEDVGVRRRMMEKRMRKMDTALRDMRGPTLYGPADAELTLVCWGSVAGPACEAAVTLSARGTPTNVLHFSDVWPLSPDLPDEVTGSDARFVAVEQNYSGQFAGVFEGTTGLELDGAVLKYDGRQVSPRDIVEELEREVMQVV
ncbi:MAG: 2-oxoacid:acceptor oxidoreductase subunit alpha [Firmicutes bacterium]|jgi:2-oxoglutarate ferredoxin oxidoreductase subunit alpha|nr:2-oxoacid:acceptor oxidoreductase subunit alpha [Bacillota bacterium]